MDDLERKLPQLPLNIKNEIIEQGTVQSFQAGEEILREGQYVKVIPIVLEGVLKVVSSYKDKEILLYYIEPEESCIMSFSAALMNLPSKVYAKAEEDCQVMLIPAQLMREWTRKYPSLNDLFFKQYNQRYEDLIETIQHVLFEKMDTRVFEYLKEKSKALGKSSLDIRHHQIASELGTAREVVSRMLKKLESENKITQSQSYIHILNTGD